MINVDTTTISNAVDQRSFRGAKNLWSNVNFLFFMLYFFKLWRVLRPCFFDLWPLTLPQSSKRILLFFIWPSLQSREYITTKNNSRFVIAIKNCLYRRDIYICLAKKNFPKEFPLIPWGCPHRKFLGIFQTELPRFIHQSVQLFMTMTNLLLFFVIIYVYEEWKPSSMGAF